MDQYHPYRDDIPAYALGALDAPEAAALEAHLQTCDTCRSELADYQQVSDYLLAALPPKSPPVSLRGRLQHRLPRKQKIVRPKFGWLSGQLAFGLVVLTLVALNLFSLLQIQTLQQDQARMTREYENGEAALAMLSSAGTKSIPVSAGGVSGTILVNQAANTGVLIIWNLPVLQQNQTYQAWLIDPKGKRTSAAIFKPEEGQAFTSAQISTSLALSNFTGLGVTVEPAGGSIQPTGQRIFKVDF